MASASAGLSVAPPTAAFSAENTSTATQSGAPANSRMACTSCHRPIHVIPGSRNREKYCMLPAPQRRSRAMNSGSAGGLPSMLPASIGSATTFQPAACSRTAST